MQFHKQRVGQKQGQFIGGCFILLDFQPILLYCKFKMPLQTICKIVEFRIADMYMYIVHFFICMNFQDYCQLGSDLFMQPRKKTSLGIH